MPRNVVRFSSRSYSDIVETASWRYDKFVASDAIILTENMVNHYHELQSQNNKFDAESRHYNELVDMMTRRDPFYEQPLIEEDQSNITAQTVSYPEKLRVNETTVCHSCLPADDRFLYTKRSSVECECNTQCFSF